MRVLILVLVLFAKLAVAQEALPWGQALSVPLLANQAGVTIFYVSSYSWNGTHTDYDMARQAADAYVLANPQTPTYLVLNPIQTQTCDAVPLPSIASTAGKSATVSIIGWGSGISSLLKRPGCAPSTATLSHRDAPSGTLTTGWYQGFTVDANHIDKAACEMYGMSGATFFDIACGDAAPGADHELEFGNLDPGSAGLMYNINVFNLRTFDTVGVGKAAIITPVWANGKLTSATVVSGGTKFYTQQYTRAQVVGPDLSTCTTIPTLAPTVSNQSSTTFSNLPTVGYGYVTGATITNAGSCTSTTHLYVLIQDGVTVTYGMKFSNLTSSHLWDLESTGSNMYGEAWLAGSGNNTIIGEHPFTNQTIQIAEYADGNQHTNTFFDSPGEYGALISSHSGSFINPMFSWDSTSYLAASGYYFSTNPPAYQNWIIQNSQCTNSTANFISITTAAGPISGSGTAPSGVNLSDIETCDATLSLNWATQVTY
jgi:hypothetical protein